MIFKRLKIIRCLIVFASFSVGLYAQTEEPATQLRFKPRYAGASLNTGFMFMPNLGTGYFFAPKFSFQTTPRLFVNAGIGVVNYNLFPSHLSSLQQTEGRGLQQQNTVTGAYVFTEGVYFLNERWSINSSIMKNTTPESMRKNVPYRLPNEAAHLGIDFRITPNVTVGARVGYSSN